MPINTILLFACGLLLGLLLRKNGSQARQTNLPAQTSAGTMKSPFQMTSFTTVPSAPVRPGASAGDDDAFAPQLASLQIALGTTRAPGKAYSAARAAGILR